MERSPRYNKGSRLPSATLPVKQRSGYEPSDAETDNEGTKRRERDREYSGVLLLETPKASSPLKTQRSHSSSRFEYDATSSRQPRRNQQSKLPYRLRRVDNESVGDSYLMALDSQRSPSPIKNAADNGRGLSSHRAQGQESIWDMDEALNITRHQNHRTQIPRAIGTSRASEKSKHVRRSGSATRNRGREKDQTNFSGKTGDRSLSTIPSGTDESHNRDLSVGEINEFIAQAKIARGHDRIGEDAMLDTTDSIAAGDIFFSANFLTRPKSEIPKQDAMDGHFDLKEKIAPKNNTASRELNGENGKSKDSFRGGSYNAGSSRRNTVPTTTVSRSGSKTRSSVVNRTNSKPGFVVAKDSYASDKSTTSLSKFTANMRKSRSDSWFGCMRQGSCTRSKSPEHGEIDESLIIQKTYVVENLRQFWADKHQPTSLDGFICHKQEAQILKEFGSQDLCPHILFKGPPGTGKRALAMAYLSEIYGDSIWNLSHGLRYFQIQERRSVQVVVPVTSSSHHFELNVNMDQNSKHALLGLVKQISKEFGVTPEVSNINFKSNYKVIILYGVDKATENMQYLIKWIIDRYSDVCKLFLCCEDDAGCLDSVKSRFKVINVDTPLTHEVMEVLLQIARKEEIELSTKFASKIASKSKQNVRKAIMALEACKAHNYPLADDQPIPVGWEETLIDIAEDILADPSQARLFSIRGKLQKLLVDFVHPKLILLKLVEHFLKRIEGASKRELYYWHAYYDKRLPAGTTALLKLEEFVAKFMSIYKRSSGARKFQ